MTKQERTRGVSQRQHEFLGFIMAFQKKHSRPPTYREISLGMNVSSKGTVSAVIERLERHGLIQRLPDNRGLRPLPRHRFTPV